jgi:hypothetical protein
VFRIGPERWKKRADALGIQPPNRREITGFAEQEEMHACAPYIVANRYSNPVREPGRNIVLFNLAKQLLNWKHANDDAAWDALVMVNEAAQPEPLPESELRRIFDNARRGEYVSTGCDDPYMADYVRPNCPIANQAKENNRVRF